MRAPGNPQLQAAGRGRTCAVGARLVRKVTVTTNLDVGCPDVLNLDVRGQQLATGFLTNNQPGARNKPLDIIGTESQDSGRISFQFAGNPAIMKVSDLLKVSVR